MKTSLHSQIPFLPSLLNRLRLQSQETPSNLIATEPRDGPTENTVSNAIAQQYLERCLPIRCRGTVFTE
jgi:hypothetical protein